MTFISTPLFPLLVAVAGLPLFFLAFRAFDQLLCLQRTFHPRAWVLAGRPVPFFFGGGLAWQNTLRAQFAARWLASAWLFKTPRWATVDTQALELLRRYRVLTALWSYVFMPVFVVVLIIAAQADQRARHGTHHGSTTPSVSGAR